LFVVEIKWLSRKKKFQNFRYPVGAHIFIGALLICNVLPD